MERHRQLPRKFSCSPTHRPWLWTALACLVLGWLSTVYLELGKQAVAMPDSTDFYKFLVSAQRMKSGESPYWMLPPQALPGDPCHPGTPTGSIPAHGTVPDSLLLTGIDPCLGPNLNPPIFIALTRPLSALPFAQAWWAWMSLSLIGAVLGMTLLMREIASTPRSPWLAPLLGSTALLCYHPTLANASLGQVGTLLLPPLLLAWRALRRENIIQAGLWIGLLAALKPFLALLWLGLLLIKQWRAFAVAGVVILTLSALGWFLFGSEVHRHYTLVASDVTWNGANWNASWLGLTERFFSGQADSVLPQGSLQARGSAGLLSLLTLCIAAWALFTAPSDPKQQANALVSWTVPASLLVSPLGWVYYFPLMSLPWLLLWQRARSLDTSGAHWRMLCVIPLLLSSVTLALGNSPRPESPTVWWGMDSVYCFALVAFLVIHHLLREKHAR